MDVYSQKDRNWIVGIENDDEKKTNNEIKQSIQSLYTILKKIWWFNSESRFNVFNGIKDNTIITQYDLPTLLTYFSNKHRIIIIEMINDSSINFDSIDSSILIECLKSLPDCGTKYRAIDYIMKSVNIVFTDIEHKSKIILIFASNQRYQKLVCDILAKKIVVNNRKGVDSNNPPPYEDNYVDSLSNNKESSLCCCLFG